MAIDKLVDSGKLDACCEAEAAAIIAKGGGTAPLAYDFANNKGFADAIAAIPSGGSLPTSISKIDGGSFSLASNTEVRTYSWSHSLGVIPRIVTVWCDELTTVTPYSVAVVTDIQATIYDTEYTSGNNKSALINTIYRKADGASTYNLTNVNAGQIASWMTASTIKLNVTQYYKAGATYRWVAYA